MELKINIVDGENEHSTKVTMPFSPSRASFMDIFSKFIVPAFFAAGYSEKEIQADVEEWYGIGCGREANK